MNIPNQSNQGKTKIEEAYPLSAMQQGMLFHSLLAPGAGVDIEQLVCELHEVLDVAALRQAWQRVLARHPVLRTNFRWQGLDVPQQEVHPAVELPWEEQDWRDVPPDEREKRLAAFLISDRRRGFDMTRAPLLRLTLFHWDDADSRLIWTFHHALLDGRSFAPALQEVFTFYEAFRRGEEMKLPPPRPYRDYIDWLQRQDFLKDENFWRQTLKGFAAPTPLVVDHTPGTGGDEGTRQGDQEIWLSTEITTRLRSLADENQLTLNTVVQGAWAVLLSRCSGEVDVLFGATRACRWSSVEGAETMMGLFINTLPVRADVNPEASLLPWLKELRAQWVAMREHEHTPLVKVQGWSEVPGGVSLFESIVVFENFHLDTLFRTQGGSWSNRQFRLIEKTNYPITIAVYAGAELCLKIGFDRSRFDDATVARMLGHLRTLLEAMADQPQQRLGDLPLLTSVQRHQLLVEWNRTASDYPRDRCIHELFEAQVARIPDAVALTFEDQQLTYRELNRRANHLARQLRAAGVGPDYIIGLCVERSLNLVIGVLGVLKAGGAYLPLDIAYPKDRLAFMLEDTQAPVLLTQRALVSQLPPHRAKLICLDEQTVNGLAENPVSGAKPNHLTYVIYTSGSTGKPKGVLLEHRSAVNLITSILRNPGFTDQDVMLSVTTLSFDIATAELFLPLCSGGKLVLASREVASDGTKLLALLNSCKATFLQPTPVTWQMLLEAGWDGSPQLKMISTGEPLTRELAARLLPKGAGLWNLYGPTETTIWSTGCQITWEDGPISIGRPVSNTQAYILDARQQPVPIGVPGELCLGGDGLARGYLNRPELTAEKFVSSPFAAIDGSARLYRTGDFARWRADGTIECLGRIDHQVKLRGYRIELGEIESALRVHEGVKDVVVLVHENVPGDKRLVAYLLVKGTEPPKAAELRDLLKARLPEYMVPSAFVTLDRFPLTPNGKLDRKALPAPDLARPELGKAFVAPRTPTEQVVAAIWSQILGLEQVGVHDNFFDLGGHSLSATRIISRLHAAFDLNLPLRSLFEAPTVASLATYVETMRWASQSQQRKAPSDGGSREETASVEELI